MVLNLFCDETLQLQMKMNLPMAHTGRALRMDDLAWNAGKYTK